MAVSGRKLHDFLGSVSTGSAENHEHKCDPCITADLHVEAHGFCVDCQEYLCKSCFTSHQRTKASRHHQLLGKDSIDKGQAIPAKTSDECIERCSTHMKEVIKFFCPRHEALGCTDCMIMGHRTCDLDYIPEKCANIGDSDECRETLKALDEKSNKADAIMAKVTIKDKEIDVEHDQATKEINTFRKEINNHLDTMQNISLTDVNNRKSSDKQKVQSIQASCTTFSSGIKTLQVSLQNNMAQKQNSQVFIDMKRAKLELNSSIMQQAEERLDELDTQYVVKRNEDIEGILSKQMALINLGTRLPKLPSQASVTALTHTEDIYVKTKEDKKKCIITGVAAVLSDKIVLADFDNKAIKIVDTYKKAVCEKIILDSEPFDVAELPGALVAVTMPNNQQVLIISTMGKLSTISTLKVDGKCYGIIHHNHNLYVVCQTPRRVLVLDMQGCVKTVISLADDSKFLGAQYITMSHESIYVSCKLGSSTIINISSQGNITAECTKNKHGPVGIIVLSDGSLLVCFCSSGTVHRFSGDLKQEWKIIDGLHQPQSICYNPNRNEVYISSQSDDYVSVYSVQ